MASGGGYYSSRDQLRTDQSYSNRRNRLSEDERMTRDTVATVKEYLQEMRRRNQSIGKLDVELATYNAMDTFDREKYNFREWMRKLPGDMKPVDRELVMSSIAYGGDTNDFISTYREKLRGKSMNNSKGNQMADLSATTDLLKRTGRELKTKPAPDLARVLRKIPDGEINYARRLFYGEIMHMLPHLDRFTMDDAEYVFQAIRDTTNEIKGPDDYLPLVKACGCYEDVKAAIEALAQQDQPETNPRDRSLRNTATARDDYRPRTHQYGRDDQSPVSDRTSSQSAYRSGQDYSDRRSSRDDYQYESPRSQRASQRRNEYDERR